MDLPNLRAEENMGLEYKCVLSIAGLAYLCNTSVIWLEGFDAVHPLKLDSSFQPNILCFLMYTDTQIAIHHKSKCKFWFFKYHKLIM